MTEQKKKRGRPPGTKNKKRGKSKEEIEKLAAKKRLRDEIWSILFMAIGIFLVVSLQTEAAGQFGHAIKVFLMGFLGSVAYILPYYLILYALLLFTKNTAHIGKRSTTCVALILLLLTILNASLHLSTDASEVFGLKFLKTVFDTGTESGGVFGMTLGFFLITLIGKTGLYIFSVVGIAICILLVLDTPVSHYLDELKIKRQAMIKQREEEKEAEEEVLQEEEAKTVAKMDTVHAFAEKGLDVSKSKKDLTSDSISVKTMDDLRDIPVRDPEVKPTSDVPARMSVGQMKIIDYMKDDDLFEKGESSLFENGIEEPRLQEQGKGLTEFGEPASESSELVTPSKMPSEIMEGPAKGNYVPPFKEKEVEEIPVASPSSSPSKSVVYKEPPIDLLNKVSSDKNIGEKVALQAKAVKLEETLHNFGVNAKVSQVTKGPAVTRYEIQPNTGVKVSSIVRLADDIALNLEAKSIRMEAPIPGKAAVGIEVENDRVNMVSIREIIESGEFKKAKSKITFAVGKDIAGKAIVADLKGMPHMLIAGSTGSGKSVCINSLIVSILYKAKPEEVKFVLIDPKVVELSNYNGIPHLLIPVVTEPSKAAAALNWAVAEMTDRYKKFAEEGVRDLESFNKSVKEKKEEDRVLPQIVIIIDELADLMMAAPSQVEEAICRLAQMARAAGMHLIVATQRPSVDIITGVIKANIPSRIAFAVSSQFDSRTILDMSGAEKLVGKGDMLFSPIGMSKPTRVQGCFISDSEVHNVIEFLKQNGEEPQYASDVLHSIERVKSDAREEDVDELLSDAIETVVRAEQASVSMLQRRFRIGYNRAARLVDMMESRGIIGPADGSRPRKVLMTLDELMGLNEKKEEEKGTAD
ncbi:FtsK/SpoIIIE family DNA translocase [Anaerovorax sp. IOR16]|uniref:FtsK/SpoIIIE family DNA translocase n=1 Tax=Anaerovorax sp. IOR16 TaxID=2773458 RepID=UPI001FD661F3|nr:DNA translocase FtsK [Anaerovorax sp. IOR16]